MEPLRYNKVLLLFILLLSANTLHAATLFQQVGISSSPNPVGSGARAVGMAGAFIAIADDATAASWNPAGLIQLESPEVSMVGAYLQRRDEFSSTTHPEAENTGEIDDLNLNYFSATYPFRLSQRNMVASLNYQRLYEFKQSFDYTFDYSSLGVDLLQDKHFRQDGYIGALGLASAIQITPELSLGATMNVWTDELFWRNGWNETYREHGVGTVGGETIIIDTTIHDRYSRFRGVNVNAGLLWNMNQYLTISAVAKTPFKASLRHKFSFEKIETVGSNTMTNQQDITEEIKLRMPLSYGIGMAARISDALSLALDLYRTEWSEYILTDAQGNRFSPVDGRLEKDSRVEDTMQIRMGGEYLFIGETIVVPVRGGIFYDPEPSHRDVKDFYGIALGTGVPYKGLIFDMAYQLRWGQDIDTGNLIATSTSDITQHLILTSFIIHL